MENLVASGVITSIVIALFETIYFFAYNVPKLTSILDREVNSLHINLATNTPADQTYVLYQARSNITPISRLSRARRITKNTYCVYNSIAILICLILLLAITATSSTKGIAITKEALLSTGASFAATLVLLVLFINWVTENFKVASKRDTQRFVYDEVWKLHDENTEACKRVRQTG